MLPEEFMTYFKFPLKMNWEFSIKVFTNDNKMAFDWLIPCSENTEELKKQIVAKINGDDVQWKKNITFRHFGGTIFYKVEDKEEKQLCRIRGWGMLTGGGGYALPADYAAKVQDAFGDYCATMLNK